MHGLDGLTQRLFDYAGMFPPAALPLEEAVARSRAFPDALLRPGLLAADLVLAPEAWRMLDDHLEGFGRPVEVCLVGIPADEATNLAREALAWEDGLADPPRAVTALEVHFETLAQLAHVTAVRHLVGDRMRLYVEPTWDDAAWNDRFDDLLEALDALNADVELPPIGLKFRCWGATALAPATVARVLAAVDERAIPLKATQGLHHALVAGHEQNRIGFLGLVTALRMCEAGLDVDLVQVMTEQDAAAFSLDDGLAWRGHQVPLAALGAERVPFTIGSCSLDEPDAELSSLFPLA